MSVLRSALLCACIGAIPLAAAPVSAARAADPGLVLYDAAGQPVVVLTPLPGFLQRSANMAAAPAKQALPDNPLLEMVRQMNAGMDLMMADPAGFFGGSDAFLQSVTADMSRLDGGIDRLLAAALHGAASPGGQTPAATQMVVTSFSTGHGSCSQTIRYSFDGHSAQPVVSVQQVGDACGAAGVSPHAPIPAAAPPDEPAASPDGIHLLRVHYQKPLPGAPSYQRG